MELNELELDISDSAKKLVSDEEFNEALKVSSNELLDNLKNDPKTLDKFETYLKIFCLEFSEGKKFSFKVNLENFSNDLMVLYGLGEAINQDQNLLPLAVHLVAVNNMAMASQVIPGERIKQEVITISGLTIDGRTNVAISPVYTNKLEQIVANPLQYINYAEDAELVTANPLLDQFFRGYISKRVHDTETRTQSK